MAVKFNGTTQLYARTANLPTATAITMCAWVRTTTAPTVGWKIPIAAGNTGAGILEFSVGQHAPAGVVAWSLFDGTAKTDFANQPKALEACFVALTNDGTTLRGYSRLARLPTLDAVSTTAPTGTLNAFSVGTSVFDGTDFFDGLVWEVRVWNRVLTAAELLEESRSHVPLVRNGLNVAWRMRTAQDTLDRSGQGRLPTITGAPTTVFDQAELLYRKSPARKVIAVSAGGTAINQIVGAWAWSGTTGVTSQLINQSIGSWSWAGSTATTNSVLNAIPGAWTWAGRTAAITQLMNQAVGAWTWSGTTATTASLIGAGVGTWSWSGTTALNNQLINATVGTWSWAGTTSALGAGVNASPGAYTWSGTTATTNSLMNAILGAWSWAGSTASLSQLIAQIAGGWTWAGTTATITQLINESVGTWSWAGTTSSLAVEIVSTPGAYTWAGTTASLSQLVAQGVGSWSWAGSTATLTQLMNASVGSYSWGGTTSSFPGGAVFPPPNEVQAGVLYGPNGNDFLGTLAGGGTLWIRR